MRFMASEMKKKRKDLKLIDDRMGRTYLHRRREVQEGHLTIEELLEKYPALTEPTCVSLSILGALRKILPVRTSVFIFGSFPFIVKDINDVIYFLTFYCSYSARPSGYLEKMSESS